MEQTLFNLSHPKAQNDQWALDPMLFTEKIEHTGFNGQDWDNVPKVAYETALFRKLAPPRMAKVVSNPSSFVLETYGSPLAESNVPSSQISQSSLSSGIELTRTIKDKESEKQNAPVEEASDSEISTPEPAQSARSEAPLLADASLHKEALGAQSDEPSFAEPQGQDQDHDKAQVQAFEDAAATEDATVKAKAIQEDVADTSSKGFEEGFQSGLLKGIEKAQEEAREAFQSEKNQLNEEISALQAQCTGLEAQALELQTKMQESVQALATQNENLQSERESIKAENALALEAQVKLLEEVTSKLDDFVNHPQRLFEPLKRLSVHIAEQLVLAELNLSGASIERLIQRCLDELSSHSNQTVTVELNSQDKARLQELTGEMFNHIQLHAVSSMQPGSVRVITDDTQVDDLIGHRLEALANNLLAQPELWREKSPFFKQPLAQRDTDIEDVRQRLAPVSPVHEENHDD